MKMKRQDPLKETNDPSTLQASRFSDWLARYKQLLPKVLAVLALLIYAYSINNELKTANNQGNLKFVASYSKDSLSAGYNQNIRKNIRINGKTISDDALKRSEWTEYGAGVKIPIYIADGSKQTNPTLEIETGQGIRNLTFEYSKYDVGGYLEIYIDDVFYTKINTYGKKLNYKTMSIDFPQHYAITSKNAIWWGQLFLLTVAVLIIFFSKRFKKSENKRQTSSFLICLLLILAACIASFKLVLSHSLSSDILFLGRSFNLLELLVFLISLSYLTLVNQKCLILLAKTKLGFFSHLFYATVNISVPFISLYLIEKAYSIFDIGHLSRHDYGINIGILGIIWLCLALLTTSIKAASTILLAGSLLAGIVTKILLITRNMPLLSYHFLQIRDGLSVADATNFSFDTTISSLLAMCWLVMIMVIFLPKYGQLLPDKWTQPEKRKANSYSFWTSLLSKGYLRKGFICALGLLVSLTLAPMTIFGLAKSVNLSLYFWTMQDTYYNYGLPVALTRYHLAAQIQKPKGYQVSQVQEILKQYPREKTNVAVKPNIILIQNESLTDYSQLTNLQFNQDPLENIHQLSANTIKDKLDVSVFAGSTANTEYEVLTSNSLAILPPNAFPFQQLISSPKNSLASVLNQQGYSSVALHPYGKDNYRRNQVYPYLGFQKSYFNNSTPAITELIKNPKEVRGYMSDESLYQGALTLLTKSKKPVFNFIVTMQGHGGYGKSGADSFSQTVSAQNAEDNDEAEDYLSSLKASDQAFKDLTDQLKAIKEPTLVVMYGDHQPILSDSYFKPYLNTNDRSSKYQTPLIFWANFDLPQVSETTISPNYLAPRLFEILAETPYALPRSSYYQFLSSLQKEVPIMTTWGYYDSSGNYSEQAPDTNLYKDYQMIQYNNVMDKSSLEMTQYYQ